MIINQTPDLVDLKITDFCEYNCPFCYQDSTKKGKHAPLEDVIHILEKIKEMGVFEIAIGGGDPTSHPQILEIITAIKELDIVANITIKGVDSLGKFVDMYKNTGDIHRRDGGIWGIGISVNSLKEIKEILEKTDILNSNFYITFQHVLGIAPEKELIKMISYLSTDVDNRDVGLLLLDYKTTGRGNNITPVEIDLIKTLEKLILLSKLWGVDDIENEIGWNRYNLINIGIDTPLAHKYKDRLSKEINIPEYMYFVKEGQTSMYIDAVEKKIGKCSYEENESNYIHLPISEFTPNNILKHYKKW